MPDFAQGLTSLSKNKLAKSVVQTR